MSIELVFKLANVLALMQWLMMAIIPRHEYTSILVDSYIIPIFLATLYTYFIITNFGKTKGSFKSLDGVAMLFKNKIVVLAGWIHYLVFDLFVGVWILRDSLSIGMSQLVLIPCLFLTLMFGPIGFLVYFILKKFVY